jgi:ABC transporter substrate binding protein
MGMTYLTSALAAKRVEVMHELVPAIASVAALMNPSNRTTEPFMRDLRAGAAALGLQVHVANVTSERDLDGAFTSLMRQQPGALVVGPHPLFISLAAQIAGTGSAPHTPRNLYDARVCRSRRTYVVGSKSDRAISPRSHRAPNRTRSVKVATFGSG